MSNNTQLKQAIRQRIHSFTNQPLRQAALSLYETLGYASDRTVETVSLADFRSQFDPESRLEHPAAMLTNWQSADLLFQLTDEELSQNASLFKDEVVKTSLLQSYVFIAVELVDGDYARGKLASITRQINRIFPMPVMVLFKIGTRLSITVINRRMNKRDDNKDVLGKVTLIQNIVIDDPHPGHLDILVSFALAELTEGRRIIQNFDQLHAAWEEVFNVELLNQRFYRELANWYFWALPQVDFPDDIEKDSEKRSATGLIRLLTRLIFCWFLKEKGLVPDKLFIEADLKTILNDLSPDASTYNEAILQNLFFATLNQRMGKDTKGKPYRAFAKDEGFQKNRTTYGVDTLYRYENHFCDPSTALEHFADVPFLNGGLFECLDRIEENTGKKRYLDGFSRNQKKRPTISNYLFFGSEHEEDLSAAYGDKKRKKEKVRGLLHILHAYKFTIVENTPVDQEIALDPELLGKVFENLLASYNDTTKTTARKQTGSFYTPRAIVEYMVDESIKAHLTGALIKAGMGAQDATIGLNILFAYTEQAYPFNENEVTTLLHAIHSCKILDPACGSGAFPMGMLHKLVYIIHKLDPDNARWKQLQIDAAAKIPDLSARDAAIAAIERDFADNEDDYGRKLYLIENCLYGVDIQPIAIQISKLRFFISLVCDQRTIRNKQENHGIRPLPNLETKFVAADTLIGLEIKWDQLGLFTSPKINILKAELQRVRRDHFAATTRQRKLTLQGRDAKIRTALAAELQHGSNDDLELDRKLAAWNPYDPQQSADFFEPVWMFDQSLVNGFDLIVGNPPYISVERFSGKPEQTKWQKKFTTYAARGDVYCLFYERGIQLLREDGTLVYITSNKWMRAGYGKSLRNIFIKNIRIDKILDFGGVTVFNSATVDTCILRLSKKEPSKQFPSSYMRSSFALEGSLDEFTQSNASTFTLPADSSQSWAVLSSDRQAIRKQVVDQGQTTPLGKWRIKISRGIITGLNDAYYLNAEQRNKLMAEDPASDELIVKLVRGRDVQRYKTDWKDTYQIIVKFGAHEYLEDRYPAIHRHLCQFEQQLKARGQCQYSRARTAAGASTFPGQHHWLELDNNPTDDYLNLFRKPKIIYPNMTKYLPFYLDTKENFFINDKAFIISSFDESLPYLTAILNSTLFRCCFMENFPPLGDDTRELRKIFMSNIPIKKPESKQAFVFGALVPMVQAVKRSGENSPAGFLEDLIDACVMECYFRDHMAARDLRFIDELAPYLTAYDPAAPESQQCDFIVYLYHILNDSSAKVRNRLLRISADSPDLLAVIKKEGKV